MPDVYCSHNTKNSHHFALFGKGNLFGFPLHPFQLIDYLFVGLLGNQLPRFVLEAGKFTGFKLGYY